MERRLGAILAADVAGYSRLIEANEQARRHHNSSRTLPNVVLYYLEYAAVTGGTRQIRKNDGRKIMATSVTETEPGLLTLGWAVNAALMPAYWLDYTVKPGGQRDTDLVRVPARDLGCHTAIVAQSGSGKSFFLGGLSKS